MADSKITDLADGGSLQAADELVVARSGANKKIAGSEALNDIWLVQILPWLGLHDSSASTWPSFADGLVSGTILDGYATLHTAANTDYVEWKPFLSAGTWTLEWITRKQTFMGIQTVSLDGTSIGTFDAYNAGGNVYNVIATITGISVATTGAHLLRFAVPTKNASSSGYFMYLSLISLKRTA